ncbi:MAG TPA: TetR/AcrR family transcriptional regulator [Rhodospirillales bacterium]|nr:TetR/AcrR family transcriptional regulator [Rhodospirillales bacterium]
MPRRSAAEKEKSHLRILEAAARLFRERGVEATSIADVMKAAGLTHGGFYKHFPSKEALVAAAFRRAAEERLGGAGAASVGPGREEARARFIARYLSPEHVGDAGHGCPLAALGTDIARLEGPARAEASEVFERMAALLDPDGQGAGDKGLALMALLVGTITIARLAATPERSAQILEAGKRAADALVNGWRNGSGAAKAEEGSRR